MSPPDYDGDEFQRLDRAGWSGYAAETLRSVSPAPRLAAEDVVGEEFIEEYRRGRTTIFEALVELSLAIFGARELFRRTDEPLSFLVDVAGQLAMVSICRLWYPSRQGGFTLPGFRDFVVQACRPEHEDALRAALRERRPGREITELLERIKEGRDKLVAHIDKSTLREDFQVPSVTLTELEQAFLYLSDVFHALDFPPRDIPA